MKEDLLHYIWQYRKYAAVALTTTAGEPIRILSTGTHNTHAGPDFTNARLQIGDLIWAGDVEIHIKSSDWLLHRHEEDAAYHNVILHVVYQHDREIPSHTGAPLPTLELKHLLDWQVVHQYHRFLENPNPIACDPMIRDADPFVVSSWLERLLVERLEQRQEQIDTLLNQTDNDWEEVYYRLLCRYMGMKVNSLPMEMLARLTPLRILRKHREQQMVLEAILFGQSGMLAQVFRDDYPIQLQREYDFWRKKYSLTPMPGTSWKFMRLRPANFPTLRLAQLAALLHTMPHLLMPVIEADSIDTIQRLLSVEVSEYWTTHYRFDQPAEVRSRKPGKMTITGLLINVIIPFLFVYGRRKGIASLEEKALDWMMALPPEDNQLIRKWTPLIGPLTDAGQTQAALLLKQQYCDQKRCLQCSIGNHLLQR